MTDQTDYEDYRIEENDYANNELPEDTYTINCNYYNKSFLSISDLITDISISGQDPNYEIIKNGKKTGEQIIDLLTF
tara:strand:- start:22 stop:252 length:231 start_codon:yes stop_codon:yes gene_type:complete